MNEIRTKLNELVMRYNANSCGATLGKTEYAEGYNMALFDVITDLAKVIGVEVEIEGKFANNKIYPAIKIAE